MNVSLKSDVEKYVKDKVKTGQFASPEEAVNVLLAQARDREELTAEDITELRSEVDIGVAEADRGEVAEFSAEDIIAERRAARKKVS